MIANNKKFYKRTLAITLALIMLGASTGTTTSNARAAPGPFCGPMDVTIALDDTGSMGGAISNIIAALPSIVANATAASGGDLRLGYITFGQENQTLPNNVFIKDQLTPLPATGVLSDIAATTAFAGGGLPEASDEAKNAAINNLAAAGRSGPAGAQFGDFITPWRAGAVKILVLITDAPPGGFDDTFVPGDSHQVLMHNAALNASANGIKVSDVFVPTGGDYAGQAAILLDDAVTSGGTFITTAPDGTGTADAINSIIESCGTPTPNLPPDCSGAVANATMLWPPNHKFVPIAIGNVTDPDGDPVNMTITGIHQDEPTKGLGSGDQSPDGIIVDNHTVKVRAERAGTGDGRVYHIDFTANDGKGGVCTGEVSVPVVPHDQRPSNTPIDQGPLFDSTVP
jgi:hypothetical protein